jgi:hypothetical protein
MGDWDVTSEAHAPPADAPAATPSTAPVPPKEWDVASEAPAPSLLDVAKDTVTAVPKRIYEAGKSAVSNIWEGEKTRAKAAQENPSNVFTDWMGTSFSGVPAAAISPVTDLVSGAVKALSEPVAGGMAYGAQAVGEPAAKALNPNAKLPTHEEVYGALEPEVEKALGLIVPKDAALRDFGAFEGPLRPGDRGALPQPKPTPPPPDGGPLGMTLSKGETTGDLTDIQREQSAYRGSSGVPAQKRAQLFADQRKRQLEDLNDNVAAGLSPNGQQVVMTPHEAAEAVSGRLTATRRAQSADLQQEGRELVPSTYTDPLDAADTVSAGLRRSTDTLTAQQQQENAQLLRDRESLRGRLNNDGTVIARNPQEASDIISAGVTRAEEQATKVRDDAYEKFENIPGSFRPKAFVNVGNDVRRVLNDPKDPFILNDQTKNTSSAIEMLDTELGAPARIADDPATQSFAPFTPARINNIRKNLNARWKAAKNTANATNDYSDLEGMNRVKDAFDDIVDNALKRKRLFDGNGRALSQAWDDANAAHATLRKNFSRQGSGDTVGPVMSKIVGQREGQAMPANAIEQSTMSTKGGLPVLMGRRLQSVLGPTSPEIGALKQGAFSRAVEPTEGVAPFSPDKIADNLHELASSELGRTHFTTEERAALRQHANDTRSSVPTPRPKTDVVGAAIDKINGVGGQAATSQELRDTLFGRAGVGENQLGVKLAQHIKDTHGVNSPEFKALQEGQLSSAAQNSSRTAFDHETAADRLDDLFNGRGRAMSDVLFSPEEKAAANEYIGNLRDYAKRAATSDDEVERAMDRITGRDGRDPATAAEVRDMLYSRSVPRDTTFRTKLAQRLKNEFGEGSPQFTAVKQGLFRHLIDPGEDLKDWGPGKIHDRVKKFMNVEAPQTAATLYSPAERQMLHAYADMMKKLEVPQAGANWSNTATFVAKTMKNVGGKIGAGVGALLGRLMMPHLPYGVSEAVGAGLEAGISRAGQRIAERVEARGVAKHLPLAAEAMAKWQKAAARAASLNQPHYNKLAIAAYSDAARAMSGLGVDLRGIVGAAAQDENNKKKRPQDQKRNGGGVNPQTRAHGGTVGDSASTRPKDHPVIHGARLAPDGFYYLPDASRPGKYLRVIERGRQQHTAA